VKTENDFDIDLEIKYCKSIVMHIKLITVYSE